MSAGISVHADLAQAGSNDMGPIVGRRTRSGAKWCVIGFLCLFTAISYVDRFILALLADPLRAALGISDTQLGLVIGSGFGILYAASAWPVAYLLDRGNRVRIVCVGVMGWSMFTLLSGFAGSFGWLLVARAGVAIGEAVLMPAAVSLVADLFLSHHRTLPMCLIQGVTGLMGAGAFAVGGAAYALAQHLSIGLGTESWRLTLILLGLPGLLLAPLWLLTVREPDREAALKGESGKAGSAIAFFLGSWRFYLPFFIAFGLFAMASYSFYSWTSTILVRSYSLSIATAGFYFGTVGMLANLAGMVVWPAVNATFLRRGRVSITLVLHAVATGLAVGSIASLLFVNRLDLLLVVIALTNFGVCGAGSMVALAIQSSTPPWLRARMTSLYLLISTLLGLATGPALCAWMAQHFFSGDGALRQSLSTMALVLAPTSVGLILIAVGPYLRTCRRTEDQIRMQLDGAGAASTRQSSDRSILQ
jgi:MFS family permease